MSFTKLPIFNFADKSLMQLQTKWAQILNRAISQSSLFNALTPTQQNLTGSGIYKTPANIFYINARLSATSGVTSFGSSYLSATSGAAVIPNNKNVAAFFFTANNYLDAVITNPSASYPFSIASSGFILIREYYQ